ncbi:hypothetical protein COMNV_01426 [Commensalibacter sp. Nvir]|nr:hypothetical protein COMNV_01426 [Commensalibacter sp. Nvir]
MSVYRKYVPTIIIFKLQFLYKEDYFISLITLIADPIQTRIAALTTTVIKQNDQFSVLLLIKQSK